MGDPTLADWLQGWGIVAGSVFSAVAAVTALALYARESTNRRRDDEDRHARQARGVFGAISCPSRPEFLERIDVSLTNFSDEVVTNVFLRVYRRDSGAEVHWAAADVLPPASGWIRRDVPLTPRLECDRPDNPTSLFEFRVWFTDARGTDWFRTDRDQPVPVTRPARRAWPSPRRASPRPAARRRTDADLTLTPPPSPPELFSAPNWFGRARTPSGRDDVAVPTVVSPTEPEVPDTANGAGAPRREGAPAVP